MYRPVHNPIAPCWEVASPDGKTFEPVASYDAAKKLAAKRNREVPKVPCVALVVIEQVLIVASA